MTGRVGFGAVRKAASAIAPRIGVPKFVGCSNGRGLGRLGDLLRAGIGGVGGDSGVFTRVNGSSA